MKKLIVILLLVATVLSFAFANADTETTAPEAQTKSTGPKEIVAWSNWTGNGGAALESFAESFNSSQSDYKVTLAYSGSYAEILAKFQATAKGSRPDIVFVSTEYVAFFADNPDYFTPVQKYIEEDKYDTSDIMANLRNSYSDANGNLLCAPVGNTVVGFFYNEKLLKEAGIDPLTDLNSFEEIAVACDKLQANGAEKSLYISPNSIYYTFAVTAEGVQYVDKNNGKDGLCTKTLILENPKLQDMTETYFSFLQGLQRKGQLASIELASADKRKAFVDGKIGIILATCSEFNSIYNLGGPDFQFGFHASPTITKGATNHGQCTGGGAMFIANNGTPDKERGAWEFMKVVMQPENTSKFAQSTGYLPTTVSGFNQADYQEFVNTKFPTATAAKEAQENTEADCFNAFLPMFGDFHQIVIDYTKKVIADVHYTPERATYEMAESLNECIELYRLSK